MQRSALVVTLLLSVFTICCAQPYLDMAGFSWAENLIFDSKGNLFVSDAVTGTFWRIYYNSTAGQYQRAVHVNGFGRCLGLAISPDSKTLYGVATENSGQSVVLVMDPQIPKQYTKVAKLDKHGNGLALHFATGLLYVTTEASFVPLLGKVYEVHPSTGEVSIILDGLWAADGAWIDQNKHFLYVSEVVSGNVIVYDLAAKKQVNSYHAPLAMLDDFTLSPDGSTMYGADFWNNTIVQFAANGQGSGVILRSGLTSPTSARFGSGYGFRNTSLYVTEGGGIFASQTNRRVLEIADVLRN